MAFLAGHMVNYSIIFLSIEWFDSHAIAGVGYALCFGPPIILGWIAGVYCDKYSPRSVLLIMQNSYLISLVLLYLANQSSDDMQLILLLSAALFSGIGWSFVAPARYSALPYYVSKEKLAIASMGLNLMVMTGFGLAPMLLKQITVYLDWNSAFYLAALLFIASSLLLIPLRFSFTPKATEKTLAEIMSSLRFIKDTPIITHLLAVSAIAYLLMGPMQVLLPTVAEQSLGLSQTAQGHYLSLIALALIIGGLVALFVRRLGKTGVVSLFNVMLAGLGIGLLGQTNQISISVLILILSAIAGGIGISIIVAGLQRFSDDQYRGRVMSIYTIISQIVPALSGLAAGVFAELFSLEVALAIIAAIILVLSCIATLAFTQLRKLESVEVE